MKDNVKTYIGLGSNIGNRVENIIKTINFIAQKYNVTSKSSLYTSEPWGYNSSSQFVNSVICIETKEDPITLFHFLKNTEIKFGRIQNKTEQYEDRIIDLDILFVGDLIVKNEFLTIPHKEIQNRKFVLVPLDEIEPNLNHPILNTTVNKLLEKCSDTSFMEQLTYKL
jgi:2-amino-4-hydroxy-6-hydroxymethyldihydropteridine diphosphokinase